MSKNYDAAVIGAGVFGAWTAFCLQKLGLRVALLDAYGAANSRASSGGESRIIRMGYGSDEIYTRWAWRSMGLWRELFAQTGRPELFQSTGVLWLAREDDPRAPATRETLQRAGIRFEELRRDELERRYPQFAFGDLMRAIYEPDSGVLLARRAVQAVVEEFVRNGGEFFREAVKPPVGEGTLAGIDTAGGLPISAAHYVFACGPWLPKLFPELLGGRIHPTRQEVFFFGPPPGDTRFAAPQMPVWLDVAAQIYGLPELENRGFKLALDAHGPPIDPDSAERSVTPENLAAVRSFLAARFPVMRDAPLLETRVCQYENTSDGNFLIDRHPAFTNVWLAGGGSGHGFKHGPALGEYVTTRIVKGGATEPRFSLATKERRQHRAVF